ncbi:MAG TPA: hypothetical protein DEB39_15780 [Planctomycetaceae bacterium]|nr:hypothetical protein [Planctomycetaceae bacterium]
MPKPKCPAGVPEWVLTYGDMMSLLLCFFIMLYAISTLEIVKAQAVSESLSKAFGGGRKTGQNFQSRTQQARSRQQQTTLGGQKIPAPVGDHDRVMNIRDMAEQVRGGVIMFDYNGDELTDRAKQDLDLLVQQLMGAPYKIEIRGHAAVNEQSIYPRYWDLSYTRAMTVKDYLVSKGIPERFFRISATGPYEPIGSGSLAPDADPRAASSLVEVMQLLDTVRDYDGSKADRQNTFMDQLPL